MIIANTDEPDVEEPEAVSIAPSPIRLSLYDDDQLVDEKVAALFLGTTPANMQYQRRENKDDHPPVVKLRRSIRYRVGDLRQFVRERTTTHHAPEGVS